MIKQIQKYGDSLIIRLDKTDVKFFKLKKDDWVEVTVKKLKEKKDDN